ncbi:hypothetical protein Y699_00497 [Aspergillus fumigatus Z5]|nr:hypothetical protein Y699_00497 [Aspergillus fumigatus Z5]
MSSPNGTFPDLPWKITGALACRRSRAITVKIWDATSGHCLQMVNAGGVIRVKSFAHINSYVELDYGIIGLSFLGFTCNTS